MEINLLAIKVQAFDKALEEAARGSSKVTILEGETYTGG